MNAQRYGQALWAMAIFMVGSTVGLIWMNSQNPGLCPPYPLLATPACIVMEGYFALMLTALFIPDRRIGNVVFYAPATVAFLSASTFAIRDVLDLGACPQLFGIPVPLCFTVVPSVALMVFLRWKSSEPAT